LVTGPDGGLTSGQTGRLTIGRKITLTFFCEKLVFVAPYRAQLYMSKGIIMQLKWNSKR
jgi:hypothetical protein